MRPKANSQKNARGLLPDGSGPLFVCNQSTRRQGGDKGTVLLSPFSLNRLNCFVGVDANIDPFKYILPCHPERSRGILKTLRFFGYAVAPLRMTSAQQNLTILFCDAIIKPTDPHLYIQTYVNKNIRQRTVPCL